MLVETPAGRVVAEPLPNDGIDWLDLTWPQCRARFARRRTRGGQEVRLLLRLGAVLRHGDLLGTGRDGRPIAVNVLPAEVCVVGPTAPAQLAAAAFAMGNLHVAVEVSDDQLVAPSGAAVEVALGDLGVPYEIRVRRFQPTQWADTIELARPAV